MTSVTGVVFEMFSVVSVIERIVCIPPETNFVVTLEINTYTKEELIPKCN